MKKVLITGKWDTNETLVNDIIKNKLRGVNE